MLIRSFIKDKEVLKIATYRAYTYSVKLLFVVLSFLSIMGCNNVATPLPANADIDSLVLIKHNRRLLAYQNRHLLKVYKVALGKQPLGAKQYEGDMRTPEGLYHINDKNPDSKFHKNLGVSYPSSKDIAIAAKLGRQPGGDIKIHGLSGQGYIGSLHRLRDWTHGCIAVTNDEIDELFAHVKPGVPINILP